MKFSRNTSFPFEDSVTATESGNVWPGDAQQHINFTTAESNVMVVYLSASSKASYNQAINDH
jgi:hypothetical protein